MGSWFADDEDIAVLVECAVAAVVVLGLLALHRRDTRELFAPSRLRWLYVLPVALALVLPDRFGLTSPLAGLAMLALGGVFAVLRERLGTIHLLLALHLSFYFLFA